MNPLAPEDIAFRRVSPDDLFERHFRSWIADETAGPRAAQLAAYWDDAVLAPARSVLGRSGKLFRARMTSVAWALVGGPAEQMPEELPLVVEVLHAGSLVVDDIQDQSTTRRGAPTLHRTIGVPLAINTGNLFYCWALDLLGECALPADRELALHRCAARAMLRCHHGQALDLTTKIHETAQSLVPSLVHTCTRLKAGALMELAASLGAIAAAAEADARTAVADFARELGTALQMLDDLSGVVNPKRRAKGREDLRLARPTWVWGWLARDVEAGRFAEFQRLAKVVTEGGDPEPLLDDLAEAIATRGRERVHEHLQSALRGVTDQFGPTAHLAALRQEIERLENSYV